MRETPASFVSQATGIDYPAENLACYSFHTGAILRPLAAGEPCPVLFRDLGLAATAFFLRGTLRRLAGPLTPIIYMRTEAYVEPYTDYEGIGRLVFLRPMLLAPWHSGVSNVYVARAIRTADRATVALVPGQVRLADAARLCADLRDIRELREALGCHAYDEAVFDTLNRLEVLMAEQEATEERAGPLRRAFQALDRRSRELAREEMSRLGITENDLCAAWHHLPRERRAFLTEALAGLRIRGMMPAPVRRQNGSGGPL